MTEPTAPPPGAEPPANIAPPAAPGAPPDTPPDYAAQLAARDAQIAELLAGKADGAAAALTAAEQLAADRAAFTAELEAGRGEVRKEARTLALDKIGVLPNFRDYVPDVDPRTADGAAALDAWTAAHPEAVRQTTAAPSTWEPRAKGPLARIMSGEVVNPLVSIDAIRRAAGGR
jgi:hypothetical protein